MESKLVDSASAAGRYLVANSVTPQESALPRADRDAMDEFAGNIRTLLGVLGHRVLDPVLMPSKVAQEIVGIPDTSGGKAIAEPGATGSADRFRMRSGGIVASAVRTSDAFVVIKGSQAAKQAASSLSNGNAGVRARLISANQLIDVGHQFEFSQDCAFPSPSQAASVVVGYSANGRLMWKAEDGRSLAEVEEGEANAFARSLAESE